MICDNIDLMLFVIRIIFWFTCSCSLYSFVATFSFVSVLFCLSTSFVANVCIYAWFNQIVYILNGQLLVKHLKSFYKSIIFLDYDKTTLSRYIHIYMYVYRMSVHCMYNIVHRAMYATDCGGCAHIFVYGRIFCVWIYIATINHTQQTACCIRMNGGAISVVRVLHSFIRDNQCVCLFTRVALQLCHTNRCSFWFLMAIASFIRSFFSFWLSIVAFCLLARRPHTAIQAKVKRPSVALPKCMQCAQHTKELFQLWQTNSSLTLSPTFCPEAVCIQFFFVQWNKTSAQDIDKCLCTLM